MKYGDLPAFPVPDTEFRQGPPGLTTRQYYKAMAMQGMLAAGTRNEGYIVAVSASIANKMAEEDEKSARKSP